MASIELAAPAVSVRAKIDSAKREGMLLLRSLPKSPTSLGKFRERYLAWENKTSAMLEKCFNVTGFMASSPRSEFDGTAISLLDLKISATTIPLERLPEVLSDIREKIRVLDSIDDRLEIYELPTPATTKPVASPDAPIFLVHGHDLARREIVRRFLEQITQRTIVVLAEQPNRGQDLLGKLLSNAQQAAFAVVILTADDLGGPQNAEQRLRARQNVVFELGLFIGLIGRDRVAALNDPEVEIPTDFSGVAYIPLQGESWQIELARELKAADIPVDLSHVI